MLFRDLKTNYPIFIFDRNTVTVTEGKVINIGLPHYDMHYNASNGMVIDITINTGDVTKTYTFKDSTEIGYADNLIISPNRDNILREVEALKEQAEQALKQVTMNEETVAKCNTILSNFNPVFKEKKETEERFNKLETSVGDIKDMILNIMNKLNTTNADKQE